MKKLISFIAFIMIIISAHSQITIQGKVKDNKGKPIAGCEHFN